MTMVLMAVKHYDPHYFSQSGRIEQELALREGDIVRQLGICSYIMALSYKCQC